VPGKALTMTNIRVLIVDDEPLARENISLRLEDVADFEVIGECGNGRDAVASVIAKKPDLLFLDIQMPDLDGFDVLESIPVEIMPVVVFVTAYDRYALNAFRVHALDYLLKPFDDERFEETLQYARETVREYRETFKRREETYQLADQIVPATEERGLSEGGARYWDRLVIKMRGRVFFLKTSNIAWVEAQGDYACLHSGEKTYLLRKTMNEMEARLNPDHFARVNRSAIVNLDRIHELKPVSRGEFMINLDNGRELKLTRSYREKLEAMLGDRL